MESKVFGKTPVECLAFYSETLRLIKFYINCLSNEAPPALALSSFIQKYKDRNSEDSIIYSNIQTCKIDYKENYKDVINSQKQLIFLEELRILTLVTIPSVNKNSKKVLQRYHIFLHLFELSIQNSKTKYQKVQEFLETNFSIDKNCIIANACRGNYGKVIELQPSLESAIEELYKIDKMNKKDVFAWKKRHFIDDLLATVLTGKFRNFSNRYEEYCYHLFHNIPSNFSDSLLDILDGNFEIMKNEPSGWLQLIYFLTIGNGSLKECERCFEKMFLESFNSDFLTGLYFLSFSRKCEFYFSYLLDLIPLNCLTVESLIRFSMKNKLKKDLIIDRYSDYLQKEGKFEQLCRFILNHGTINFVYTKEFMTFFINNFDKFRPFIKEEIKDDATINFICRMSSLDTICEQFISFLFFAKYFEWYCEEIIISLSKRCDLSDKIILEAINTVFELERSKGVSLNHLKSILAQKLIN